MPDHHLQDDRDVEQILKLAVRKAGLSDDEALRQRLHASGSELGLTDAQIQAAEEEYHATKAQDQELAEFKAVARKDFYEHLGAYVIVNAGLVIMNLATKGHIGWAVWPILGWGIGIGFHALGTFFAGTESFQSDFEKWRRKRGRRRGRARGPIIAIGATVGEREERD